MVALVRRRRAWNDHIAWTQLIKTLNAPLPMSSPSQSLDVISYAEGLVSDAEVEIEALYPEISAAQVRCVIRRTMWGD